jgi:hypothetical protein
MNDLKFSQIAVGQSGDMYGLSPVLYGITVDGRVYRWYQGVAKDGVYTEKWIELKGEKE